MKRDNEIFVRVVRGNRVMEDMSLAAAKANRHRGWKIEDPNYDEYGNPKKPVKADSVVESVLSEIKETKAAEIPNQEVDAERIEKIKRMRSVNKLGDIAADDNEPFEIREAARERVLELS